MPAKFTLSKDADGKFQFLLLAANGAVVAKSATYATKASALNGLKSVRKNAADAKLEDTTVRPPTPSAQPAARAGSKAGPRKSAARAAAAPGRRLPVQRVDSPATATPSDARRAAAKPVAVKPVATGPAVKPVVKPAKAKQKASASRPSVEAGRTPAGRKPALRRIVTSKPAPAPAAEPKA